MTNEITKALEVIKHIADRAIIKGNILTNTDEVYTFINSFQLVVNEINNLEKQVIDNLQPESNNNGQQKTSNQKQKTEN